MNKNIYIMKIFKLIPTYIKFHHGYSTVLNLIHFLIYTLSKNDSGNTFGENNTILGIQ